MAICDPYGMVFCAVRLFYSGFSTALSILCHIGSIRSSWSRGSVPSSHAKGQQFEPRCRQYFKLLLDPGDFHSNPSGLLSFNKSALDNSKIIIIINIIIIREFSLET